MHCPSVQEFFAAYGIYTVCILYHKFWFSFWLLCCFILDQFNHIAPLVLLFFLYVSSVKYSHSPFTWTESSRTSGRWRFLRHKIKVISGAKFITARHCPSVSLWIFDLISVVTVAYSYLFHFPTPAHAYLLFEWKADGADDNKIGAGYKSEMDNNKQVP